jgi:serine/threonine protein kinase
MGIVLSAIDPALDRPVAVKLIRLDVDGTQAAELEQRFLREARVAARVTHSSIASVFDAGREGDSLFLVMELVQGESLAKRLAEGRFPTLPEALEIASQVADALAAAHAAGVVHRDIKPANILLTRTGQVKVSDFGVAKAVGESTELTRTGTVVGSPAYMAPEQIQGAPVDGRADLFSLGVVLYEMLLRRRPFPADTVTTLIYQVLHQDPFEDGQTLRVLGPDLAGVLRHALAKQPLSRVADAATFARSLRSLAPRPLQTPPPLVAPTVIMGGTPTPGSYAAALPSGTAPVGTAAMSGPITGPPPLGSQGVVTATPALSTGGVGRSGQWLPIAIGAALLVAAVVLVLWQRRPDPPPSLAGSVAVQVAPATTARPAQESLEPPPQREPMSAAGSESTPAAVPPSALPFDALARARELRDEGNTTLALFLLRGLPSEHPQYWQAQALIRDWQATAQPPPRPSASANEAAPRPAAERPAPRPVEPMPQPSLQPLPEPAPLPAAPRVTFVATFETQSAAEFNVSPEDATVEVNGRAIGIADDWDGSGGAEAFTFPGPGTYTVRLSHEGYQAVYVRVIVRADADEETADIDTELLEED